MNREEINTLFYDFQQNPTQETREKLINLHINLVHSITKRFQYMGDQREDLTQVGILGLIKAIDRFELQRGNEFITFATSTIIGEIKKYFRDKMWGIKIPRKLKDINKTINDTIEELKSEDNKKPTYEEVSKKTGISVEKIIEWKEAMQAYRLVSLNKELSLNTSDGYLLDKIGVVDTKLESIGDQLALYNAIKRLQKEESFVLINKFFKNLSQTQISKLLHISQMQVSRLQNRALGKLKRYLTTKETY